LGCICDVGDVNIGTKKENVALSLDTLSKDIVLHIVKKKNPKKKKKLIGGCINAKCKYYNFKTVLASSPFLKNRGRYFEDFGRFFREEPERILHYFPRCFVSYVR